jgi:hypothetical protein
MTAAAMTAVLAPAPALSPVPSVAFGHSVQGVPRLLLRLEGACVLGAALLAYARLGGSWTWFAVLFLLPDLSLLGYLAGPRRGAAAYNVGHSYLAPALLAAASVWLAAPVLLFGAAIWCGHIGFDRMLGYGLKYGSAFGDTHLGQVGRRRAA